MTVSRTLLTTAVVAAAAVGGVLTATPAVAAAPPGTIEIDYDAAGSSHIAKPNTDVKLGPTTITTYLNTSGDGSFTGSLPLPATKASFAIFGFVPTNATVNFVPAGPVTGTLNGGAVSTVSATATYYIKLTDVTAGGIPTFVGDTCQTTKPVSIPVATPAGQSFDVTTGGTLKGTYTIGEFANCGFTTGLINALVPGSGNTVTLQLGNGRVAAS